MFAGDNDPSHNLQRLGTLLLSLLLALLFMIPAQAQSTFGALRGTVTDANGSVVSNATVKVTNENQSATREATRRGHELFRQDEQDFSGLTGISGSNVVYNSDPIR